MHIPCVYQKGFLIVRETYNTDRLLVHSDPQSTMEMAVRLSWKLVTWAVLLKIFKCKDTWLNTVFI